MLECTLSPAAAIARCAANALREELETYPKPGLVSFVDHGSHPDMDAECFLTSIAAIEPFFEQMAAAGSAGCELLTLQKIGISAEEAMLAATQGRNTHRGAIFCLGLLTAAAGWQTSHPEFSTLSLGGIVRHCWGDEILLPDDLPALSAGLAVCHRHGLGGVRSEAKQGFPSVFEAALPAFRRCLTQRDRAAARVQTFFVLLEICEDTTLWKRGGIRGPHYAKLAARRFLRNGGVIDANWVARGTAIHRAFVRRNLTAGGAADLLAATLFANDVSHLS